MRGVTVFAGVNIDLGYDNPDPLRVMNSLWGDLARRHLVSSSVLIPRIFSAIGLSGNSTI
jgi:hypothetical protein